MYNLKVCHGDTGKGITMNNDIKKMTALMAISGIATMLLLVILMIGYDYVFVKVLAGFHMLYFEILPKSVRSSNFEFK